MTLPFIAAFAAILAAGTGRRASAIVLWLVTLALLAVLFRLHATDSLPIAL